MKLTIVTETFPPEVNGVAMTLGVITRELARRGHEVKVIHPRRPKGAAKGAGAVEGIECSELPGFSAPGYREIRLGFPCRRRLVRRWREQRPDLVHVVTEGPMGASAVSAARQLGIPVTSSFHTNFHSYTGHYGMGLLQRLTLAWLRHVHNRTLRTFAPTEELCAELRGAGFRNLGVLSRGVDLRSFSPARRSSELRKTWDAGPENPVVLHVGRMAHEKNYPLLFRSYQRMREANPMLRFVLAGEGPLRESLMRDNPWCHYAGFLSREEIGRYYASADIYIHASTSETFGNVLTEAMASGLACAGFNYAAARQFVRHEHNGLVRELGDEEGLLDEALRLATDEALRGRLRRAAPDSLSGQSWEAVIEGFELALLEEVRKAAP